MLVQRREIVGTQHCQKLIVPRRSQLNSPSTRGGAARCSAHRLPSSFLNSGNGVDAINLLRTESNFIALSESIEYQAVLHREFCGVCAGARADCPVGSKLNGY